MNGGVFEHYKKKHYKVIGVGRHTETLEEMVTYFDEMGDLWVRPLKMFIERVTIDGETIPRFKRIG
ncbi:MAG: DUF1653 domain-containing protein [Simkaniaceae bacterium]|nr:MAG: DUF1653 domain-containing protein [Simkaniaceae bacterium]